MTGIITSLFTRPVLFLAAQLMAALILLLGGVENPFFEARRYWILFPIPANLIVWLLIRKNIREGVKSREFFWGKLNRLNRREVMDLILIFVVSSILGTLPNVLFGSLLFNDVSVINSLVFPGIPLYLGVLGLLWPLTQPISELPLYFGYSHVSIGKGKIPWSFIWAVVFLTLQHIFLPFISDWNYILWRIISFLPISFFMGYMYVKRVRLRRYILISHFFLDLPVVVMSTLIN